MGIPVQRMQNIKRKRTRRPSEAKASFNEPINRDKRLVAQPE